MVYCARKTSARDANVLPTGDVTGKNVTGSRKSFQILKRFNFPHDPNVAQKPLHLVGTILSDHYQVMNHSFAIQNCRKFDSYIGETFAFSFLIIFPHSVSFCKTTESKKFKCSGLKLRSS